MEQQKAKKAKLQVVVILLTVCLLFPIAQERLVIASADNGYQGIVRVLLTRLKLTDRLDIALDGSYSLEGSGLTFQRGSKLVVSSTQGTLILYYEGMTMDAGKSLILRRHMIQTTEENGLRLNNDYDLYPGDLVITMKDQMLRAVLHIPMEEYLMGVVPYEMSDSFPLEALKAQAITARTYAMKRTDGSQDYDVVDNTNDQVFTGINKGNEQAMQAVLDTAGIVEYYKDSLASCYYSASNGGQTELEGHVWDNSSGISTMRDDPYDLANPLSIVNKFEIPRSISGDVVGNETLTALLKSALQEQLASLGYDDEIAFIRIASVEGITAHTPRYDAPSKLMTRLRFDLRVEARKMLTASALEEDVSLFAGASSSPVPSVTPQGPQWSQMQLVEKVLSVDLAIFPEVESALELSINGASNEIVSVSETINGFSIESRRFGHGVGMSQRGAEWMAREYDWTCEQILDFYYPDAKLQKVTAQVTLLPPVQAEFLATPGPPATPTPRPTLMPVSVTPSPGQWLAKVTQIAENSTLNMRDEPGMQGTVIRQLFYGQILVVIEEEAAGWLRVKTDAMEGYVMASFLEKVEN